jgi:5'(3')-deoxyribonucleotidase
MTTKILKNETNHSKRMIKIGVDIDGVLRDFAGELIKLYKRDFPKHKIYKRNFKNYDIGTWFEIGDKIYEYAFQGLWSSKIFINAKLLDNNYFKFVKDNIKDCEIYLVTTQANFNLNGETLNWIQNYNINHHGILFLNNGWTNRNHFDILIDDCTENLNRFDGLAIAYAHPWNKDYKGVRAKNFTEINQIVKQYKSEYYDD